jgi:alpha-1,2-mannosyltransferase
VPPIATAAGSGAGADFDRHFRRAVWIAMLLTVIGAGLVYVDKASDDRSAFIRWRPQVLEFWKGVNIYDVRMFPNPPILPISLYPLMTLPPLEGALAWYALKVGLTALSVWFCFQMVRPDLKVIPSYVQGAVLLLSFRPILGDLHHGNNNLLILFLICAMLLAWRKGYDVLAGLLLGLAIAFKVTPALFVPYFMYKRSWRTVWATFAGLFLFIVVIPSLVIGPRFNYVCFTTWYKRMLGPYVEQGVPSAQEINQSMVGVLTRLLTDQKTGSGRYDVHLDLNLVSWPPAMVSMLVKGLSIGLVVLLVVLCRTRTTRRDDHRLFGEFALVVLTMLFVSERSWKHHYVTLLLPYTYLCYRIGVTPLKPRVRAALATAVVLSTLFMATTSTELGGLFARHQGHKIAQGYGMFLWAGVVLYIATAWRVWSERNDLEVKAAAGAPAEADTGHVPHPHFAHPRSGVAG